MKKTTRLKRKDVALWWPSDCGNPKPKTIEPEDGSSCASYRFWHFVLHVIKSVVDPFQLELTLSAMDQQAVLSLRVTQYTWSATT